ncbi:MAG TPA: restriction endonuclease subunit S [Streptomyces sp.]|uniref:restriction endonuclease subunit S n=1 Tax=Streptomyces sp. TaxID=1931 RepID=UPI002C9968D9|nr:restriction endonuclease subunit S [Streptomyces sp.]HWU05218.1 restriction endonuclease subunit S [Streptomyces sp.]
MVPETRRKLMLPDLIYRLVPDPTKLDADFLGIVVRSPYFRRQIEASMRSTSGQFKISKADIQGFLIPKFSLSAQRRIVALLDSVNPLERSIVASIAKIRDVRSGLLLSFIASVGHEKPREAWVRVPLREVVPSIDYGVSDALVKEPTGIPVLRMNNIREGRVEVTDLRFSPAPVSERLMLRRGDVLFNRTNSIEHVGKSAVWENELPRATFASYLVRLNPDLGRITPEYLAEWLRHPLIRQRVKAISTVAVQQVNVNPTRLRELEIDLPVDLEQQRTIVQSLAACDDRVRREESELAKLRQMRAGIVDDLLAGGWPSARGLVLPPPSDFAPH